MVTRWVWVVVGAMLADLLRIGVAQDIVWEPTYGPASVGRHLALGSVCLETISTT